MPSELHAVLIVGAFVTAPPGPLFVSYPDSARPVRPIMRAATTGLISVRSPGPSSREMQPMTHPSAMWAFRARDSPRHKLSHHHNMSEALDPHSWRLPPDAGFWPRMQLLSTISRRNGL